MPTARFQHGGNIIHNYTFALEANIVTTLFLYTNSIKTNPGLATDLALNIVKWYVPTALSIKKLNA